MIFTLFFFSRSTLPTPSKLPPTNPPHTQFGPTISQAQIDDVCRRMLALKESCVRKGSGEPYIVSSKGGRNCSVESVKVCLRPFSFVFFSLLCLGMCMGYVRV